MQEYIITIIAVAIGIIVQFIVLAFYFGRMDTQVHALESRVAGTELDIRRWQNETMRLAAIDAKLDTLSSEMVRIRDRFDSILEKQAKP